MSNNVLRVPRESTEFQEVIVDIDDKQVTEGLEISITAGNDRPVIWAPVTIVDGKTGFTISGMSPGEHSVWVRISQGSGDKPVRFAGILVIT